MMRMLNKKRGNSNMAPHQLQTMNSTTVNTQTNSSNLIENGQNLEENKSEDRQELVQEIVLEEDLLNCAYWMYVSY